MDRRGLAQFVRRDWPAVGLAKTAYWAERFRLDWRTTWDAGQQLLKHARDLGKPFPTSIDRELDIAAHVQLRARLDRAAHAFARR